jgi:hypothetical protein
LFVVGRSAAERDWPYVQPGPDDVWAGSREHTFTILFGLRDAPPAGECRLAFDLLDTHRAVPPRLRVSLNGKVAEHALPIGAGDDSIFGAPAKGREHRFELAFPASNLRQGENQVHLTTLSGSWLLYDWVGLQAPAGLILTPVTGRSLVSSITAVPALVERAGKPCQTIRLAVRHLGETAKATAQVDGVEPVRFRLQPGSQIVEVPVPAVDQARTARVSVAVGGQALAEQEVTLKPVRRWVVYLLPHSHVDIGYTHLQTDVERAQWRYLEMALETARRTASHPPGAQFKWNVEVLWAVDSYLRQATPAQQQAFFDAVKAGQIGLQALYGNELTGLCRPEELLRLVSFAQQLGRRAGVAVDTGKTERPRAPVKRP